MRFNAQQNRDERRYTTPYDVNSGRPVRDKYYRLKTLSQEQYEQHSQHDVSSITQTLYNLKDTIKSWGQKLNPFAQNENGVLKRSQYTLAVKNPTLHVDDQFINFEDSGLDLEFNKGDLQTLQVNGGKSMNYFSFVNSPNPSDKQSLFEPQVRPLYPTNTSQQQIAARNHQQSFAFGYGQQNLNNSRADSRKDRLDGFNSFHSMWKDEEKKRASEYQSIWTKYNMVSNKKRQHKSQISVKPTFVNAVTVIVSSSAKKIITADNRALVINQLNGVRRQKNSAIRPVPIRATSQNIQKFNIKAGVTGNGLRKHQNTMQQDLDAKSTSLKQMKLNDSENPNQIQKTVSLQNIAQNNIGQLKQTIVRAMTGDEMDNFKLMASHSKQRDQMQNLGNKKMEEFIENQYRHLQPRIINQQIKTASKKIKQYEQDQTSENQAQLYALGELKRTQQVIQMERTKHEEEMKGLQASFQVQMKEAIRQLAEQAAQTKDIIMQKASQAASQPSNVTMSQQSEDQTQFLIKDMQNDFKKQIQSLTNKVQMLTETLSNQKLSQNENQDLSSPALSLSTTNNRNINLNSNNIDDELPLPAPNKLILNSNNLLKIPQQQPTAVSLQSTSNQQSTYSSHKNENNFVLSPAQKTEEQKINAARLAELSVTSRQTFGALQDNKEKEKKLVKQDSFNLDFKKEKPVPVTVQESKEEEIKVAAPTLLDFKSIITVPSIKLPEVKSDDEIKQQPLTLTTSPAKPVFSFNAIPSSTPLTNGITLNSAAPKFQLGNSINPLTTTTTTTTNTNAFITGPMANNPFLKNNTMADAKPNPFMSAVQQQPISQIGFVGSSAPPSNPFFKINAVPAAATTTVQATNPLLRTAMNSNPFGNAGSNNFQSSNKEEEDMQIEITDNNNNKPQFNINNNNNNNSNSNFQGSNNAFVSSSRVQNSPTTSSNFAFNSNPLMNKPAGAFPFSQNFQQNNNNNNSGNQSQFPQNNPFVSNFPNNNNNMNSNNSNNSNSNPLVNNFNNNNSRPANNIGQFPISNSSNNNNSSGGGNQTFKFNAMPSSQSNNNGNAGNNRSVNNGGGGPLNVFSSGNPFLRNNTNQSNTSQSSGGGQQNSFQNKPFTTTGGFPGTSNMQGSNNNNNNSSGYQQQNSYQNNNDNVNRSPSLNFSLGVNNKKQQPAADSDDLFNPMAGRKIYKATGRR